MDRRQQKTRRAIFSAFTSLLSKKNYNQISVQEIIDTANVGRTTFYAHFETKDYLLKELCEELFAHIVNTAMELPDGHQHKFCYIEEDSVFLHLLRHLEENDLNILGLLSSENNEIFLKFFKENLKKLVISQYIKGERLKEVKLPKDFLLNHIVSSFAAAVMWWVEGDMRETPETVTEYFLLSIDSLTQ